MKPTREKLIDMAFKLAKTYEREMYPHLGVGEEYVHAVAMKYGLSSVFVTEVRYL